MKNEARESLLKDFDEIIALMKLKTKAVRVLLVIAAVEFSVILILGACLIGSAITK